MNVVVPVVAVVAVAVVVLTWRLVVRPAMLRYERALAAARHEAMHDGLTGALARAAFARELERRLAGATPQRPLALLAIDVDGFGEVNKLLGHAAGDELLVQLVRTAAGVVREQDAIGRLGGDEFALLVRGDDARAVADRILLALRGPGGPRRGIDVSIGDRERAGRRHDRRRAAARRRRRDAPRQAHGQRTRRRLHGRVARRPRRRARASRAGGDDRAAADRDGDAADRRPAQRRDPRLRGACALRHPRRPDDRRAVRARRARRDARGAGPRHASAAVRC